MPPVAIFAGACPPGTPRRSSAPEQVLDPVERRVGGELPGGAVRGDLVVLDPLRGADQRGLVTPSGRRPSSSSPRPRRRDPAARRPRSGGETAATATSASLRRLRWLVRLLQMHARGLPRAGRDRAAAPSSAAPSRSAASRRCAGPRAASCRTSFERMEPHLLSPFRVGFAPLGFRTCRTANRGTGARSRRGRGDAHDPGQPHRNRGPGPDRGRHDPRHRPPALRSHVATTRRSSTPPRRGAGSRTSTAIAGILRYRGYPIEQLAEESAFLETAWLLFEGELPTACRSSRRGWTRSAPHVRAREREAVPRRLPLRRASDGDVARRRCRALDVLSRGEGDRRRREPPPAAAAADREVPHHRGLLVPPQPRPAVRLPARTTSTTSATSSP